jgi:hypothetical protein
MAFLAGAFAPPPEVDIFSYGPVLRPELARIATEGLSYFEWGIGRSTRMALQAGCRVIVVEHDVKWYDHFMSEYGAYDTIEGHLLTDPEEYINIAKTAPEDTGLYFVDGIHRAECLLAARARCLRQETPATVLLHDGRDPAYVEAINVFSSSVYPPGDTDTLLLTV